MFWQPQKLPRVTRALDLENRRFVAPWQPLRPGPPSHRAGQREAVEAVLEHHEHGAAVSLVLDGGAEVVDTLTFASNIRGVSSHAASATGWRSALKGRGWRPRWCGRPSATFACTGCRPRRPRATSSGGSVSSTNGVARSYVHIVGRWQDNVLYQLLTPAPQTVVTY